MSKYLLFVLFGLLSFSTVKGQDYFDIKIPEKGKDKKCKDCLEIFENKPEEVHFSIIRELDDLYFQVTTRAWFDKMFKKGSDGIAIDIIAKSRYDCAIEKIDKSSIIKGDLQRPIYLRELKANIIPTDNGTVLIRLGRVPDQYIYEDVEFNLIILKKRNLCYYTFFVDIETYRWDLLDMGMFFDTLTYSTRIDTLKTEQAKYLLSHKKMRFEVPFEKNKSSYSQEDIKPIYDSLQLTDFNIKKISIKAYSSVEGNTERNLELQEQRAESIVNALQEFQKPTITNEVIADENWVEFLNDISLTKYDYFVDMSKEEIKEELKGKEISSSLEPYLKEHRKAIVVLELQKKNAYKDFSNDELIGVFQESITDQNLQQAIEIQNSIFDKVRNKDVPIDFIDKLEIPEKTEYGSLLNKSAIFKYMMNPDEIYDTYMELKKLEELLPNDGHIKYNMVVLKFKVWLISVQAVDPELFRQEITALTKYGIPSTLVKRMLVNYTILLSEYLMAAGDYQSKDKTLKYIYSNYKYLPNTSSDYLSLAQYFSSYTKYDWAKKILIKKVNNINVDEDLLFYYLNLTLNDTKAVKKSGYRTVLQNAINLNSVRFCNLFKAYQSGGISFQLLENDRLRKVYCETCN